MNAQINCENWNMLGSRTEKKSSFCMSDTLIRAKCVNIQKCTHLFCVMHGLKSIDEHHLFIRINVVRESWNKERKKIVGRLLFLISCFWMLFAIQNTEIKHVFLWMGKKVGTRKELKIFLLAMGFLSCFFFHSIFFLRISIRNFAFVKLYLFA